MDFRTVFTAQPSTLRLNPHRPIVLLGSCFSDYVGRLMRESLWDAVVNPTGVLFNPLSIARLVRLALGGEPIEEPWLGRDGLWHNWDFPTQFTSLTAADCDRKCRDAISQLLTSLRRADALILTFGTSIVYSLVDHRNRVVANCHKQPSSEFVREMVDVDETVRLWHGLLDDLRALNPMLKFILTVSPVRHIKEGFADNSRSKSRLLLACEELSRLNDDCVYFPAFEILTDDLRDYRFYESDMVHPSAEAAQYIYQKFKETFLNEDDCRLLEQGRKLTMRCHHRPLVENAPSQIDFEARTASLLKEWHRTNPTMLTPNCL